MNDFSFAALGRALRTYFDIVMFRRGPEDLPVSPTLLLLTIAANVLLGLALSSALPLPEHDRISVAVVGALFLCAWYWALLRLAGKPERFLQTATAIFGFQTVLLPAFMAVRMMYPEQPTIESIPLPVFLVGIGLELWTLAINSRIVRSATQWSIFAAVAVVLLQSVIYLVVIQSFFPETAASAAGAST